MGIEQRQHPRFGVHLAVTYSDAEQFVTDYALNLSVGGLFIAGASQLPLQCESDVTIELPGQGSWTVRARSTFVIDPQAAQASGRTSGAGMQIVTKPPGFDDALLGYLLRLGRRRDHTVMIGEVPGVKLVVDAGYRVVPLEPPAAAAAQIEDPLVRLLGILVPPADVDRYREVLSGHDSIVCAVRDEADVHDILARIDSLL